MSNEIPSVVEQIATLFELTGIQRVVCVDDAYNAQASAVIQLCLDLASEPGIASISLLQSIDFSQDASDLNIVLRAFIPTLSDTDLDSVFNSIVEIYPAARHIPDNIVVRLLQSFEFIPISPTKWKHERSTLLEQGKNGSTLFLFDMDLSGGRADEGMQIIKAIQDNDADKKITCGLISAKFAPEQEYKLWKRYQRIYKVKGDRFLLISKAERPELSCAEMIKLVVLNRFCSELITSVLSVVGKAQTAAKEAVKKINIYDFEHIIFKSGQNEGIWEPDTLIRVFGIYHRAKILDQIRQSSKVKDLATKVRTTSGSIVANKAPKTNIPRTLMHLEQYENRSYLKLHHVPLDLGDIFEIGEEGRGKLFILLEQSCDLMVRPDQSGRNATCTLVTVKRSASDNVDVFGDLYRFYLPFFDSSGEDKYFIEFKRPYRFNLDVLDLCVFDSEGECKYTPKMTAPSGLFPAWNRRFHSIETAFEGSLTQIAKLKGKADKEILTKLLPRTTLEGKYNGTFDESANLINYNIRRVLRLRQPYAGDALIKFSAFGARLAFEHNLDR